ncbi:MAG: PEP-CTERM sorting domain-containing protein [Opitutales bacterium]|nr:PEP-CTERM sorting domain-containing protein [Opitutales bacterium]
MRNFAFSRVLSSRVNSVLGAALALAFLSHSAGAQSAASYDWSTDNLVALSGGGTLPSTTSSTWWYGCGPTSAGMMMAYYDTNGYKGYSFDNLIPGTAPTSVGGYSTTNAAFLHTIASEGHQRDFYSAGTYGYNTGGGQTSLGYELTGDDLTGGLHSFDCLADFTGASQGDMGNGGAVAYYDEFGSILTAADLAPDLGSGVVANLLNGIELFVNYCGYSVQNVFSQLVDEYVDTLTDAVDEGFSFGDYAAEIDEGRPVILHYVGHFMLGVGYEVEGENSIIQFYNTWDNTLHEVTWGQSYDGMDMLGVVGMELYVVPEPSTYVLLMGSVTLVYCLRRRRAKRAIVR